MVFTLTELLALHGLCTSTPSVSRLFCDAPGYFHYFHYFHHEDRRHQPPHLVPELDLTPRSKNDTASASLNVICLLNSWRRPPSRCLTVVYRIMEQPDWFLTRGLLSETTLPTTRVSIKSSSSAPDAAGWPTKSTSSFSIIADAPPYAERHTATKQIEQSSPLPWTRSNPHALCWTPRHHCSLFHSSS